MSHELTQSSKVNKINRKQDDPVSWRKVGYNVGQQFQSQAQYAGFSSCVIPQILDYHTLHNLIFTSPLTS